MVCLQVQQLLKAPVMHFLLWPTQQLSHPQDSFSPIFLVHSHPVWGLQPFCHALAKGKCLMEPL